jgi:hypothetical protein
MTLNFLGFAVYIAFSITVGDFSPSAWLRLVITPTGPIFLLIATNKQEPF